MNESRPTLAALIVGTVIVIAAITAWLIAELHGVSTGPLLNFVVPVVGGLFLVVPITAAGRHAQQAANQTNGVLDARLKAAAAAALADRDAARTRQAQGDIAEPSQPARRAKPPEQAEDAAAETEVF